MKRGSKQRGNGHRSVALLLVLLAASAARADQVTSKGTVLRGKVTAISGSGITFEPEYGKGALTIKWADIEDLKTDGNFQLLYGEDEESDTPLQGFSNGVLYTGPTLEGATQVEIKTIHSGVAIGPEGPGWRDKIRSTWRYWDGSLTFAFNTQQATTDTLGMLLDFYTIRKKDPTRLIFDANYRYGNQKPKGGEKTTIQDQWYGLIRGEYDIFVPGLYAFASGEATYDAIQKLSIRGIPKAGLGYTFLEQILDEEHRNFLAGEVGGAWVFERYFQSTGTPDNDYFAIAFALVAGYHLPYGAHFDGRVDYLPAVDDFTVDYLLRSQAALTMPLIEPISAKLSVLDEYDNTPAAGTDRNSLFIAAGLSLVW